ncbi:hypothetical protein PV433_11025 [Paenibacillus sp. GYB004]|uniref:hypothetical protein n=1 Tax=Paenibacillus sp. GYB004 TaxID=2994393 RepID=UPI002F962CB0
MSANIAFANVMTSLIGQMTKVNMVYASPLPGQTVNANNVGEEVSSQAVSTMPVIIFLFICLVVVVILITVIYRNAKRHGFGSSSNEKGLNQSENQTSGE